MQKCRNCFEDLREGWSFCRACGVLVSQDGQQSAVYGSGVRLQVFEVIVRQALSGAPWQEICAGPMQVNSITEYEIKEEIERRRGGGGNGSQPAGVRNKPRKPSDQTGVQMPLPSQANSE